jgi:Protein of unknown function (DUF2730)
MPDTLDFKTLSDWLQWLAMAGISLVVWLRKPGEDAAHAVNALREDLAERHGAISERVTRVEESMRHMPTSEELERLAGTVGAIKGQVEAQSNQLTTLTQGVTRIENYLLHSK